MGKHSYNPSTWEARAEGLQVLSQPELSNKVLSQKLTNRCVFEGGVSVFLCALSLDLIQWS